MYERGLALILMSMLVAALGCCDRPPPVGPAPKAATAAELAPALGEWKVQSERPEQGPAPVGSITVTAAGGRARVSTDSGAEAAASSERITPHPSGGFLRLEGLLTLDGKATPFALDWPDDPRLPASGSIGGQMVLLARPEAAAGERSKPPAR